MGCIVVKGWRIGRSLDATALRVGSNLRMTAGLVCAISEVDNYEAFFVLEGAFYLVDGKTFNVLKYELPK